MSSDENAASQIIIPESPQIPDVLPVVILSNQVVFPLAVIPIRIQNKREIDLVNSIIMGDKLFAVVTSKDPEKKGPELNEAYGIGSAARILQMTHLPDGSMNVVAQAIRRVRIGDQVQEVPFLQARVQDISTTDYDEEKLAPLTAAVRNQMRKLITLSPNIPDEMADALNDVDDPGVLADVIASNLTISLEEKQSLLATVDREERLKEIARHLAHEIEILEVSAKIQTEVQSNINKGQREYYLRQQLKAIREELGETGPDQSDAAQFRERIEALDLPEGTLKEVMREVDRLEQINEQSAEYPIITTYLEWICELPWNTVTEDRLDIEHAEKILNEDHYGLDKVKKRILEFLAVRKLKPEAPGPILCFVGPPGVGKTSLGKSIARALGRNFERMSLGGMRDEAEIRGHRRTYVGAMPGRIIQNMRKAGSKNPVIMLDEIDKIGSDFRGDPSSALLEVLDPAQNDTFTDHYLNAPFDLSRVMFIATANVLDTIPWALRDRMEIIPISGYTSEEKLNIAQKYLVPRQRETNGLKAKQITITKSALRKIISDYTREAGVRNLEREIGHVCRGVARLFATDHKGKVSIKPDDLTDYLGKPKVHREVAERTKLPGVATGLAWTATGGDILFIEATRMPGKGRLTLTGQLGDVMKESANAVLSYIRTNAETLGLKEVDFAETDLHVHVPAGATPKDGPSAGVAMLCAITSVLMGKPIKNGLAMTGEITLRGSVLPVGGIKEKVLAAQRAGLKEVIIPERNEADLEDVPESARKKLKIHLASHMEDALQIALGLKPTDITQSKPNKKPAKKKASKKRTSKKKTTKRK